MGQISGCMIVGCGKDVTVAGGLGIVITNNTLSTIHVTSGTATATNQVATTIDLNGGTTVIESVSADNINVAGGTGDFRLGVVADVNVGAAGTFTTTVGANVTGTVTMNGAGAEFTQSAAMPIYIIGNLNMLLGTWRERGDLNTNGTFIFNGATLVGSATYKLYCQGVVDFVTGSGVSGYVLNVDFIGDTVSAFNVSSLGHVKVLNNSIVSINGNRIYLYTVTIEEGSTFENNVILSPIVLAIYNPFNNYGSVVGTGSLRLYVSVYTSATVPLRLQNFNNGLYYGYGESNQARTVSFKLTNDSVEHTCNYLLLTGNSNNGYSDLLDLNGQTLNVIGDGKIDCTAQTGITDSVGNGVLRAKILNVVNDDLYINGAWKLTMYGTGTLNMLPASNVLHHLEQEVGATTTLLSDVYCNIKEIKGTIIDGGA